jgi:pimeloyl-ACP methyl ester carboxylesterase
MPLRVYPGAGHFLPEERPFDVATDIAELIATVAADGATESPN